MLICLKWNPRNCDQCLQLEQVKGESLNFLVIVILFKLQALGSPSPSIHRLVLTVAVLKYKCLTKFPKHSKKLNMSQHHLLSEARVINIVTMLTLGCLNIIRWTSDGVCGHISFCFCYCIVSWSIIEFLILLTEDVIDGLLFLAGPEWPVSGYWGWIQGHLAPQHRGGQVEDSDGRLPTLGMCWWKHACLNLDMYHVY